MLYDCKKTLQRFFSNQTRPFAKEPEPDKPDFSKDIYPCLHEYESRGIKKMANWVT
jgi:hypothetical protein